MDKGIIKKNYKYKNNIMNPRDEGDSLVIFGIMRFQQPKNPHLLKMGRFNGMRRTGKIYYVKFY
ncbi:MAG: hypothetical protein BZ135_09105 [Methanosphaera sp. rholeuAM6]|nr:MAG: hypothetical protein BZ135_09105 [Methanosphaera sp. rholeuAM6]